MPELPKARSVTAVCALTGAIGIIGVLAYMHPTSSPAPVQSPSVPVKTNRQVAVQAKNRESSVGEPLPLSNLFGINQPAPPPIVLHVGPSPHEPNAPDLSSPAAAVHSVLSLIEQAAATDTLASCFFEKPSNPASKLYPGYLGQPVGLVDVMEGETSAEVTWEATVHTAFSLHDRQWSPSETITLTARVVQIEGLWKLLQLHDGDEDGNQ